MLAEYHSYIFVWTAKLMVHLRDGPNHPAFER